MKFEPHLPQLPSIGELLEHPRVKGVVQRINRSTLAHRAAGFLDEMRTSLAQRAGRVEIPSLTHLAERLARRLLGEAAAGAPLINATGVVVGDPQFSPPLAERALHAVLQLAGEFHGRPSPLMPAIERELCTLTGAESAYVACNFEAASILASGVHAQSACRVDAEPLAGLIDPVDHGYGPMNTIGQRVSAGADLVVADGAGLLGGPACGLLVGRQRFVDMARQQPLATPLAVDAILAAALEATLEAYRDNDSKPAIYELPLWQLLSAPLANLEQRARRLAPLMAESAAIASAEAQEAEAIWAHRGGERLKAKSWTIVLNPASGDAPALAAQFRRGPHPIAAVEEHGAVRLDLRTVFPRWDQQLVAAVDAAGT